ncbi:MAG: dioxygenase [Betaproteobacteria bacterium]|nr:dioxygenase [Betaproteobacteria bacterium]
MLPSIFISHGSPMHALDPGAVGAAWRGLAAALPRPKAILVASAHWDTQSPMLTAMPNPDTFHDFYGFPEPLYRLRYPAPGSAELARQASLLLADEGIPTALENRRGLDHGVWSILLHMYPQANIPVVQVSLQTELGPAHHYRLGQALAPLAADQVLLIGSGQMTHNLREWGRNFDGQPAPYVVEFQAWVHERIVAREHHALMNYRDSAPHAVRAHPSDEHFLPLFFALGAGGNGAEPMRTYDAIEGSVLAMDVYTFTRN